MRFVVESNGCEIESHFSEDAAIAAARARPESGVAVVALDQSGTYQSRRQVWPTASDTHTY